MKKRKEIFLPKGYSLWLMPEGVVYTRFLEIINQLAEEFSAPVFEPHVTLLGGIEGVEEDILSKTQKLAFLLGPYKINFSKIDYEDFYFRALYLRAEKTEEVAEANQKAREIFDIGEQGDYMPHLSFMYGDFPESQKQKIIQEIGNNFPIGFEVASIDLFKTEGEVSAWYRVKKFPFF